MILTISNAVYAAIFFLGAGFLLGALWGANRLEKEIKKHRDPAMKKLKAQVDEFDAEIRRRRFK